MNKFTVRMKELAEDADGEQNAARMFVDDKRIDNEERLRAERRFRTGDESGVALVADNAAEPFAFMHRSMG